MSGENSSPAKAGVPLQRVVKELTDYAPLALAESWDNVGLLVEPYTARDITSIMLTNDLTKPVMDECLSKNIDMIISYHPPIFVGKKRITNKNWQDQIIACCLENRIAVYSPHTTWDSVRGGLSDWLASAFGQLDNYEEFESVSVLEPYCTFASPADHEYAVVVGGRPYDVNLLLESGGVNITSINIPNSRDPELKEFRGTFKKSDMFKFQQSIYTFNHLDVDHYKLTYEVYNRVPLPVLGTGVGRLLKLRKTMTIAEATDKMKTHLDVKHARIAYAVGANAGTVISSIALVPGSGAKPLSGVRADLYVTGEMLHHDVLAATHNGTSVLMSTHSDSERGFLKQFAQELRKRLGGSVAVTVSAADRDPIQTV